MPLDRRRRVRTLRVTDATHAMSPQGISYQLGAPRPRLARAVLVGGTARRALMGLSRGPDGRPHETFSGKRTDGAPLEGHRHAFFLCDDADGDGVIDTLLVWCRSAFDARALMALDQLSELWGEAVPRVELVRHPAGMPTGVPRLLATAATWRSLTPFVPTRHAKLRGGRLVDGPTMEAARACAHLGLPHPVAVEAGIQPSPTHGASWRAFVTERAGGGRRAGAAPVGLRLRFASPVAGPIALGYGAHYGLGLFVPDEPPPA